MNKQEELYFTDLSESRARDAVSLESFALEAVKDDVVEKYSDQAHFIYELLQNADDASATNAKFILEDTRLIFAHNGTKHFSITNPATEKIDNENGTLGDINSITSIGKSSKSGPKIGKFGVGFKAVFKYTQTPYIYDSNFKFRIERFIVPIMLSDDFPGRKADETMFIFPFNHPKIKADEAYMDISDKLRNLSYPLLFLMHLEKIEFKLAGVSGAYIKTTDESFEINGTLAEHLTLIKKSGNESQCEKLWLFTRFYEENLRYSVGLFTDGAGHLKPVNEPAFCFFPTRESTNLNFILHAPFLLTASRETIRAGEAHNDKMISLLADLAADSIEYLRDIGIKKSQRLIDDNILKIIPYDSDKFTDPSNKNQISFLPFYEAIKNKFKETNLIPSDDGYVSKYNAYWATVPQLTKIFNNAQLGYIVKNDAAKWAFTSLGREEIRRTNPTLCRFIDELVYKNLDEKALINGNPPGMNYVKGIDNAFIEKQEISWLHIFYKWISETESRKERILTKPIFLDQKCNAVAAFDDDKQQILFLPVEGIEGYTVVNEELLTDENTLKFLKAIGIKEPSKKDQIYNIILPQYEDGTPINADSHFMMFFNYYCKCTNDEINEFIGLIKEYAFLNYHTTNEIGSAKASEMYLPSEDLVRYFASKPSVKFIDLERYKTMVGGKREEHLISFLTVLGINLEPFTYPAKREGKQYYYREAFIDGLLEIIEAVEKLVDSDLSVFLWLQLCKLAKNGRFTFDLLYKTIGTRKDRRYSFNNNYFDSSTKTDLLNRKWLVNCDGNFVSAIDITKSELSSIYDTEIEGAKELLSILELADSQDDEDENDYLLSDRQREKIHLADKLEALGISEEDLEDFWEFKRQKEARKRTTDLENNASNINSSTINAGIDDLFEFEDDTTNPQDKKKISKATQDVIKDIARITKEKGQTLSDTFADDDNDADEDEYMPSVVDYSKKIESAKQKSAAEIDKITRFEELQNKALSAERYTYGWFTTLLEMERINSGEANSRSREVSISFAKVEREPGTKRTLVLKHPSQYIPQFMEDLADISLVLHMKDQTKAVAIDVASIKSYTLRVKMKNADDIAGIDLNSVISATIDAKSPAFLLKELQNQFANFEYEDDFNMQDNLCENIEFVFGPPGTGKTTHLAKNVLLPMMSNNSHCKVLVLTPTNKSADVLAKRIMEVAGEDDSYNDWLVRFGATCDEEIEQSPVFKEKTFDIRKLSKNVTVTTIARFPYDFFMPEGARIFLHGINWDYIVIDEASMIPIANIIFPLYKKTPKKFIIAGDPFQIEPITSVDIWKNENIYTMVRLKSFVNPDTVPHQYKVELLTTQYRSVPDIGDIFSKFAYDGILKHHRSTDSQKQLNLCDVLDIETLNIIKFPVRKYESIYRCKRLQHSSSYQIYSAIFTFEYVSYLSRMIAENNPGDFFRIGVIAPYRAQADMIDKLLASERLPKEVDVQVGTIHGFQGDECDIVFAVFNTPPSISDSQEMFLNKKNIINVSISRARDYLFIVVPDDDTENINNLRLVKKVERLIKCTSAWNEDSSSCLEELMFGDAQYIENNTFSTGHQSVNVYGLPEKQYEVRTEDTAVDVQIHKEMAR